MYQQYLIPTNRVIPLVISENGIDGGTCGITGCSISGGWENFCGYWNTPDCSSTYMTQLEWYDSLLLEVCRYLSLFFIFLHTKFVLILVKFYKKDNYVVGSTIFCLEIDGWDDFDITPMVPDLITYLDDCC